MIHTTRTSLLLINAILMHAGLSSVAEKKSKPQYLRAMRQADDGDFSRLENIIADGLREIKEKICRLALIEQGEHRTIGRRYKARVRR